jgi:DNA-binding CsgD family transcriptional regulator
LNIQSFKHSPVTFKFKNSMQTICKPLFTNTDIIEFSYCNTHSDTSKSILTTNLAWYTHFFSQEYYKKYPFELDIYDGYYIKGIQGVDNYAEQQDAKENFNLDHMFCIRKGTEKFTFYTRRNNDKIHNFYRRNYDVLEHFILYFKDRGEKIIQEINCNPMRIYNRPLSKIVCSHEKNTYDDFFKQTKLRCVQININSQVVVLSNKDAQTVLLTSRGLTAVEIGKQLGVSQRTIESRLNNLKIKTNTKNKKELISVLLNKPNILHYLCHFLQHC